MARAAHVCWTLVFLPLVCTACPDPETAVSTDLMTFSRERQVWVVPASEAKAKAPADLLPWLESQPSYESLAALGKAWPDLAKRTPTPQLAAALASLQGLAAEQGTSLRDELAKLRPDPARAAQRFDERVFAPDPAKLAPPALTGTTLVSYELGDPQWQWDPPRTVHVSVYRATYKLGSAGWTREAVELEKVGSPLDPEGQAAAATRFGGPVLGQLEVPVGAARLRVAFGRQSGAAPVVWSEGGEEQRYPSWKALLEAHPAAGAPAALTGLTKLILDQVARDAGFEPLADPQTWIETWEREYRDVTGQHYREGNTWETVTRHTLSAPERLRPPAVEGEVLRCVAASRAKQPKLLSIALADLGPKSEPQVEALTTQEVISDGSRDPAGPPTPR